MKVNDKRRDQDEQTGSSIELELAILHQEVQEKILSLRDIASFKLILLVLSMCVSQARGPIPPVDLLTQIKENLDAMIDIEKKQKDD